MSTNEASQTALQTIEVLELCKDQLPTEAAVRTVRGIMDREFPCASRPHSPTILALAALAGLAGLAGSRTDRPAQARAAPLPSLRPAALLRSRNHQAGRCQHRRPGMVRLPPGVSQALSPLSIRRYIMNAYGAMYAAQVVGGPDWLNKDAYNIKGKVPDELEAAFQNMKFSERNDQTRAMQQSLLADRFHLKAHFETRVLPVYELVPAKGGLKITEVPAPPERKPGDPTTASAFTRQAAASRLDSMTMTQQHRPPHLQRTRHPNVGAGPHHRRPDERSRRPSHRRPHRLHRLLRHQGPHLGALGRRRRRQRARRSLAHRRARKKLGIKLVPAKDPIEVLVIDSIDRPSEN
jgi:uncharacterized protein (TIGR03435 family)